MGKHISYTPRRILIIFCMVILIVLEPSVACSKAINPFNVMAKSRWGSPQYGDPPGFCPNQSPMDVWTYAPTNNPQFNPEEYTFWGVHRHPGYDDWYGYWYGDFRGKPGDASGWKFIMRVYYPHHGKWDFYMWGWSVQGHVKQYIAYYNWTFGGQCGFGYRGKPSPPPYMADVYGYPVADLYVDDEPPQNPSPYVYSAGYHHIGFTWAPVKDRGSGGGKDYFAIGFGHFTSWYTIGSSPVKYDLANTYKPRHILIHGLPSNATVCVHVIAVDLLGNATSPQTLCASTFASPDLMQLRLQPFQIGINPYPFGIVGVSSWFWITNPQPVDQQDVRCGNYLCNVTATPVYVSWRFGDGATEIIPIPTGLGKAWPNVSTVQHVYQSVDVYAVNAAVVYSISYYVLMGQHTVGPFEAYYLHFQSNPTFYNVLQLQPYLKVST